MRKLDIGSGGRHFRGYETLDKDPVVKPDHVHNIENKFPFPDNCFNEVRAFHILEHIHTEKKNLVMYEIWRILKPSGILDIEMPTFPHPQAVMDPTHLSLWHRYSFWYYEDGNKFRDAFVRRTREPMPRYRVIEESQEGFVLKIKLEAMK